MSNESGKTTIVVGASRGLGRGIAAALAEAGERVVAVARSEAALTELSASSKLVQIEVADAREAAVASTLLERHDPESVVVVAGAAPSPQPLQLHSWETFSVNWETDVRIAFHWLREALLKPLRPGSRVVVVSSGAALRGSPLSGGYAGAKATQRFIAAYAQEEANRSGLEIAFSTLFPQITPATDLGRPAVEAYAARGGVTVDEYVRRLGEPLTPSIAGAAVLELLRSDVGALSPEYLLTGAGLQPLPATR